MTKRAPGRFQRNRNDFYATPPQAAEPLLPYLEAQGIRTFAEPCSGDGALVRFFEAHNLTCTYAGDIRNGNSALALSHILLKHPDCIITNPPYVRPIMHVLIKYFISLAPTWLLLEFDWFATYQAVNYVRHCTDVVPIGRVKWIPNSPSVGFDNYAWAHFRQDHDRGPHLHSRDWWSSPPSVEVTVGCTRHQQSPLKDEGVIP